jgi:large subunit ribosomal protein L21
MADIYAIVESGGKQYRAEKGTTLVVDRIKADEGDKVNLRAVMFRGDGDDVVIGGGDLEKVKVEATVTAHERGEKIRVFKYRAKKGFRKRQGHRSELTRLEVTEVKMLSRKPAAKKAETAKDDAPAKDEAATEKKPTAAKKPAEKKPPAKKPAAKKPPAKKPAAKKTEEDS